MKGLLQYRIPFTGLKPGKHVFEFDIDERFFSQFEYSLVKSGELSVELELDKQETMLILIFRIHGKIFLSCDLCLADYPFAVDQTERVIAKFGEGEGESDTEEIIVLARNAHEIDVSGLIYEYVNLSVPYITRCGEEGNTEWCDQEMIGRLRALSVPGNDKVEEADPRWEALKKIKDKE